MNMRAKFAVSSIEAFGSMDALKLSVVMPPSYDKDGLSEDATFARYSPSGTITLSVTNPALLGVYKPGQKFYVDFTAVKEEAAT